MLDYILNNKEWLFSGIGVTVLGLLFIIIRYFYKTKYLITKKYVQYATISQQDVYKIMQELEAMPPLHLDDVTKNYIGLNVDWLTKYSSANKKDDDLIRVSLNLITKSFRPITIWCEVNLSDYKQLSILRRNAKIRITGKIARFEPYSIGLSDVKLFFQK